MAETNIHGIKRPAYDKSKKGWHSGVQLPQKATFDPQKDYCATIHTTLGDITVKFYPDVAPQHVTSWINLAEIGFYDGVAFHRIIPGFMMQGGDPTGSGSGGPAYKMKQEFNSRKHVKGTLSAARTSDPDTAGSQFFVCFGVTAFLDNQYTVFGEATGGLDVVAKFEKLGTPGAGTPTKLEKITSVDVFTKDR